MALMEVIIRAVDEASDVIENIAEKSSNAFAAIENNLGLITAGGVLVGGAISGATAKAESYNESVRRSAILTGESEEGLRKMIQGLSDHNLSNEDAVDSVERLIKSGVREKEQFEELLPIISEYANATGVDMVHAINQFDSVLSAMDIPLTDMGDHLDELTFLQTQTTVSIGDLGGAMRKEQDTLRDLGLSVGDVTVAMAALDEEGVKGPKAIKKFQDAVIKADGDTDKFWATLDVGADALANQRDRLEESTGLTEKLAESNTQATSIFDQLKASIDNAVWSVGDFITPIKDLGPLMMGLGPAIKTVSFGAGLMKGAFVKVIPLIFTAATAAWGFAAALLANPITWIVLAIIALIAIIVLLVKNWDKVSEALVKAWDWIKDKALEVWDGLKEFFSEFWEKVGAIFTAAWDFIKDLFMKLSPLGWVISNWEPITEWLSNFWGTITEFFVNTWETIKEVFDIALTAVVDFLTTRWENIKTNATNAWNAILDFFSGIWARIKDLFSGSLKDILTRIGKWQGELYTKALEAAKKLMSGFIDTVKELPGKLWDILKSAVQKLMNIGGALWDAAKSAGSKIWSGIKKGLGMRSPGYIEKAIDDIADRAAKLPGEMARSFSSINGLDVIPGMGGAAINAGRAPIIHEHRFSGVIKLQGGGIESEEDKQKIIEIVIDEVRREVRF